MTSQELADQHAGFEEQRARSATGARTWHVVTPEFPPAIGGVGDYVHLLAKTLCASGDEVHVWSRGTGQTPISVPGVHVHSELGKFHLMDLCRAGRSINRFKKPRQIVLQWVPHGFGLRAVNLPFCIWMWIRARMRGDQVTVMLHESFLPFRAGKWRQNSAALVQRLMTVVLLQAASRVCVSTMHWTRVCKPYALGRRVRFDWLPLPSNVPVTKDPALIAEVRARYAPAGVPIVGHFGTFGDPIAPMLHSIVPRLLERHRETVILLIGPRSDVFRSRLVAEYPQYAAQVFCTGAMAPLDPQLSAHLSACDLMIQPFPDGVSSRRTSLMAPLAHAVPLVTTSGQSTEPLWLETEAVRIVPASATDAFVAEACRLLSDPQLRKGASMAATSLYEEHFAIEKIAETLCGSFSPPVSV